MNNPALARILPFAIYIGFLALESGLAALKGAGNGWVEDWDLRWVYPVKAFAVAACLLFFWRHYTELASAVRVRATDWLFAVAVGVVVFVLWVNLDQNWLALGASDGYDPTSVDGGLDWFLVISRILGAAVVVPLMEELFWRSFLLRWLVTPNFLALEPAKVTVRAFLITAVFFGFEHNLWFAGIVAGVAYGWLYMRTSNLWVPIISHGVTNAALGVWVVSTANWQFW